LQPEQLISPYPPREVRHPVMLQTWRWLTFLHWRYEPEVIRRLLPAQMTLDTFDGSAWVGLTPFLLTNLRAPFSPAVPWISRFPETNVRTYVRGPDGERGVWFFTLEAARLAAVIGARSTYRLPYRWARMSVKRTGSAIAYRSTRQGPFGEAFSDIEILPGTRIEAGNFDNFLTARYRLYTLWAGRIAFAQIEHEPWRLHTGRVKRLRQTLFENVGLPRPAGEPTVHFSENLEVRIERLRREH
jgi:hypothetical protein